MSCGCNNHTRCSCQPNGCPSAIQIVGLCDPSTITFEGLDTDDRNWTEVSIPEVLHIPPQKPDIETIDKVFVQVKILSKRVIRTPISTEENAEGTKLTGWKLVIEGVVKQKVVYTAWNAVQSVHSAHFTVPFSAFIILPGDTTEEDRFCVETCVEDVFVKAINDREIFKNVTLFLKATKEPPFCPPVPPPPTP
ncbi:DUF3794 domain-containing protein [Pseudalkalibacillus hwajinpoensis]|nr:DUF3794 domain-containing protein [Pseudalkalibacillus hwajinpoensis]